MTNKKIIILIVIYVYVYIIHKNFINGNQSNIIKLNL